MQSKTRAPKAPAAFADTEPMPVPQEYAGDTQYADTVPQPLLPTPKSLDDCGLSLAPLEVTLYEAMAEIRKNHRVCPYPTRWLEFYRVLQDAAGGAQLPSPPLSGSAWAATPPSAKRMSFCQQVEWAAANNCLKPAYEFLRALPDSDWLCVN